jgi:hypothetical protein
LQDFTSAAYLLLRVRRKQEKFLQHASPNRKTKFVPPAEELQEMPLPSDPKVSVCLKLLTC